ncbi:MAG: hypothetical protein GKS01_00730 [Alphaproteobacteria bacterium]|nr:hypothetical protein [Alphaproteobacteria bacterium]
MQNQPLLDRQIALLSYLTDPRQYDQKPEAEGIFGIDPYRLRLEGRFSLEKRTGKLMGVFRRSFEAMRNTPGADLKSFAAAHPPHSITRYDNAAQFFEFVSDLWQKTPPEIPHLPDLAALELALSKVMLSDLTAEDAPQLDTAPGTHFRLLPGTEFLICEHDIRPLLAGPQVEMAPEKRPVYLLLAPSLEGAMPRVLELKQAAFEYLKSLQGWTSVADAEPVAALVSALIKNYVMETNQ